MASSDCERIEKFHEDSITLMKLKNVAKLVTEIKKLSIWMQKHQTQTVPDNHKQQLLTTLELYYNYLRNQHVNENCYEALYDAVYKLADDYLKLPEGKLVHSKGKKKILKWMDILNGQNDSNHTNNLNTTTNTDTSELECYTVIDVTAKTKTITLSECDNSDHIIEDVKLDKELFRKVHSAYEAGDEVLFTLDNSSSSNQMNSLNTTSILKIVTNKEIDTENNGSSEDQSSQPTEEIKYVSTVLYSAPPT